MSRQRRGMRRLPWDRRGSTAIEFAIVSFPFFLICLGMIEAGIIFWTQNAMQSAATLGARCAATGNSACSNVAAYVSSAVANWAVADTVPTSEVSVQTAGTCNGTAGTAIIVSITHHFWGSAQMPPPFSSLTSTVSSCYAVTS
jgi:Flp pilus assembly protein TadG